MNKLNNHISFYQKFYNLTELLFCFMTGVYLVFLMLLSSTYGFTFPAHTMLFICACVGAAVALKTVAYWLLSRRKGHTFPQDLAGCIPVMLLYGLMFLSGRYSVLIFCALLTLGCLGTDYRKIIRTYVGVTGIFILCTILCALCGGITNLVYLKDGAIRSSWGIYYPTDFASYLIYILVFTWIVSKDKRKCFFIFSGLSVTLISWFIARSSTSTICGILFLILVFMEIAEYSLSGKTSWFDKSVKVIRTMEMFAFPIFAFLILGLMLAYKKGIGIAYVADRLLSSRISLACRAYDEHGFSLFGTAFKMIGFGGSTFANANYNFVDSSYALILLRYGLIYLIVIAFLWTRLSFKAARCSEKGGEHYTTRLTAGMALIAFHSISEHHFIEPNFNILIVMPFALYTFSSTNPVTIPEKSFGKHSRIINSKKSEVCMGIIACIMAVIFFLVAPGFLSRMRTICSLYDVIRTPCLKVLLFIFILALVFIFSIFSYSLYNILLAAADRRKPGVSALICLLGCMLLTLPIYSKTQSILNQGILKYEHEQEEILNEETAVIEHIMKDANGSKSRLYVDKLPELYRKRIPEISRSIFSGDELARYKNVTVVMNANYESACFLKKGFLYGQISPKHAIYTNDPAVIQNSRNAGLHLTGYYSKEKKVPLEMMAESNDMKLTDEGSLILSKKHPALTSGPDIGLREGNYTAYFKLRISPDSYDKKSDEDYVVCTLHINTLFGENNVINIPVHRSEFNKKGACTAEVKYWINESVGTQFLISAESKQKIEIQKISYRKTPDFDTHYTYDSKGRIIREEYYDLEGNALVRPEGNAACEYDYDQQENMTDIRYYDTNGNLVLTSRGYAKLHRTFNIKRQITREEYFGADGKPLTLQGEYASVEYKYDADGNQNELSYYDIDNQPVLIWNCYAKLKRTYNKEKKIIREENYGTDGQLFMRPEGYAIDEREYDKEGNVIRQYYFDVNGEPVLRSEGYAAIYRDYDDNRKIIREEYYDTSGRRTAINGNRSAVEYEYDNLGNQIVVRNYDIQDQPVMFWNSYSIIRRTFNDQRQIIKESFFDTEDQPVLNGYGYACEERSYDSLSNVNVQKYLGLDGKPILRTEGYAEVHKVYDEGRHVIEEEYFGTDGKTIALPQGYSKITRDYDEKGNLIQQNYYDIEGNPVS